jgi:hypothetical protein
MTIDKNPPAHVHGDELLASSAINKTNKREDNFGYEAVKRRSVIAREKQERAEQLKFTIAYVERCARRFRKQNAGVQESFIANSSNSIGSFLRNERTHIAIAGICVTGFIGWAGITFYSEYAEKQESVFSQQCAKNNFNHSSDNVCYDGKRHVYTLNRDGTARKSALDWNVWRNTEFADRVANP